MDSTISGANLSPLESWEGALPLFKEEMDSTKFSYINCLINKKRKTEEPSGVVETITEKQQEEEEEVSNTV